MVDVADKTYIDFGGGFLFHDYIFYMGICERNLLRMGEKITVLD